MIVAVTGTPGTGKSSVAEEVSRRSGFPLVKLNEFVKERGIGEGGENGPLEVDVEVMVSGLEDEVGKDAVVEGHMSHFFPADLTVVLRCEPLELERRLEGRGWSEEKIGENVESEILDVILQEAVEEREMVMEIDTSEREAEDVAGEILDVLEGGDIDKYRPGSVEWDVEEYYGVKDGD